jgi:hypothetical protein
MKGDVRLHALDVGNCETSGLALLTLSFVAHDSLPTSFVASSNENCGTTLFDASSVNFQMILRQLYIA